MDRTWGEERYTYLLADIVSCLKAQSFIIFIFTHRWKSYHSVLVIDFNHNDRWVVSQLRGLPEELHIIKHQQLVPCRAERLTQDLHTHTHKHTRVRLHKIIEVICKYKHTYLSNLTVCRKEDPSEGIWKATTVGSKKAAGLVHVRSQLEHLLHCHTDTHVKPRSLCWHQPKLTTAMLTEVWKVSQYLDF